MVDESENPPIEIESLCPGCHENGITKLISINIPFYRQVIVMSFACEHCGLRNNNLQSAEQTQEFGTEIVLKVKDQKDLNRTVVRSEYGMFEIPEIELTIPPKSNSGDVTTVEGILQAVKADLVQLQPERRQVDPETALKLDRFIERIDELLSLQTPWTLKLHDPTGNCFVQNPNPFHVDPNCITSHYCRPVEEDRQLGFLTDEEATAKLTAEDLADREWKSYEDVKNEVLRFPGTCQACGAPCETRMKPTDIPYFQTVIIMSTDCDRCGFKSNDVKSGGATQAQGCRLTVRVQEHQDLTRDLLKSDTCSVHLPEIDVELGSGVLSGRFTTVEGLLSQIREQLERQAPFFLGDSALEEERNKFQARLDRLGTAIQLKEPFTLVLDDPAGNSYIQSLAAPVNDSRLQKEFYTRTYEQNEELGLNDMRVENYQELDTVNETNEDGEEEKSDEMMINGQEEDEDGPTAEKRKKREH